MMDGRQTALDRSWIADGAARADWRETEDPTGLYRLLLPLYFILLAFFIMLAKAGSYDPERGETAMRSLSQTFTAFLPVVLRAPGTGEAIAAPGRLDPQTILSLTELGFAPSAKALTGGGLTLSLDEADVFASEDAYLTARGRATLSRLARALEGAGPVAVQIMAAGGDDLALKRAMVLDEHWPLIAPRQPAMIGLDRGGRGLTVHVDAIGAP